MYKTICKKCFPWSILVLRLVLAAILIFHGYPKLFGDTSMMLKFFESTILPAPAAMLTLAGIIELLGGVLLILGLGTRYVAKLIALQFLVIILFVKWQMGWAALEFDLLIFVSMILLITSGAGKLAVDSIFLGDPDHHRLHDKGGHGAEAITGGGHQN